MINVLDQSGDKKAPVRYSVAQIQAAFALQGVTSHRHYATVCPICGTVQSMSSLVRSGADIETVERFFGFSCEGRFSGAGPWPSAGKKQAARRSSGRRGCNYTLGGLFKIFDAEIEGEDGRVQPMFDLASPEQARRLEADLGVGSRSVG